MDEYKCTTINGYQIELEIERDPLYPDERFTCGSVNKGDFHASLQRFMEGYPLEDGCGEDLVVSDGTFKRIERWALANGY
jgi:hypothetical protein